jgi:hypothetical protein
MLGVSFLTDLLQALSVPDAGNPFEVIELVAPVVIAHFKHRTDLAGLGELLGV